MHEKCHNEPEEHDEHVHGSRVNSEAHGLEFEKGSRDGSYKGLDHDGNDQTSSDSNRPGSQKMRLSTNGLLQSQAKMGHVNNFPR